MIENVSRVAPSRILTAADGGEVRRVFVGDFSPEPQFFGRWHLEARV